MSGVSGNPGAAGQRGETVVIVNPGSGRNSRGDVDLEEICAVLGARRVELRPGEGFEEAVRRAVKDGARRVISAGGDGTAMAVASALLGSETEMGVLPMGTFNYFARGLGLSEDPLEAARQIADGEARPCPLGTVNGHVFLNNVSLGVYPAILRERETVYARWGRHRMMAYWSVLKTFARFRKPLRVTLRFDDSEETRRTALIFVGRSSFQFRRFGLAGQSAIDSGRFAVLVVSAETRWALVRASARLALRAASIGRDYTLLSADRLTIEVHGQRRPLIAYDGEKERMGRKLEIKMSDETLLLVHPAAAAREGEAGP